mgnify:CR=1 FL=1|tara:strand:+ start:315 stop:794 length:480 start_codon:yes stop_codon:yes gene_type:complete
MAVPSSGILTMLGLAQERKWNTYGSGPPIAHPILMTDLINGGGLNSFPALNTLSPYKPNTSTPHAMNEWYGYDQDYQPPSFCYDITLRYLAFYKFAEDSCFKGTMTNLQTTNNQNWWLYPLATTNSNCMNSAPAGSYSDNNVWAVWSGSAWTITGFCQM